MLIIAKLKSCNKSTFFISFFIYFFLSKNLSAKYCQEIEEKLQKKLAKDIKIFTKKEKKKSDNMVVNVTKIFQKMKNRNLHAECRKKYYRMRNYN